jgi:hypothetical protein
VEGEEVRERELVEGLEKSYKYYNGWVFQSEYPGFLVYHKMNSDLDLFFTPDFDKNGHLSIQFQRNGEPVDVGIDIGLLPYQTGGAYEVFRLIAPFLDYAQRM